MTSQGFTSLLWFLAILALIPLALWLLKRTPMGGAAGQGVLRSVAALPLSTSQRIVTVEVGRGEARRWLVLGVTPQSITTLHTMAPQDVARMGYEALMDGKRVVVTGAVNKAMVFSRHIMPVAAQAKINKKMYENIPEEDQTVKRGDKEMAAAGKE